MTSNFRYDKYINDERSTSEKILDYNNYLKSHLINKKYAIHSQAQANVIYVKIVLNVNVIVLAIFIKEIKTFFMKI